MMIIKYHQRKLPLRVLIFVKISLGRAKSNNFIKIKEGQMKKLLCVVSLPPCSVLFIPTRTRLRKQSSRSSELKQRLRSKIWTCSAEWLKNGTMGTTNT